MAFGDKVARRWVKQMCAEGKLKRHLVFIDGAYAARYSVAK